MTRLEAWVVSFVVAPKDSWVLDPVEDGSVLTLTTGHPRYGNHQRLVARLGLTDGARA